MVVGTQDKRKKFTCQHSSWRFLQRVSEPCRDGGGSSRTQYPRGLLAVHDTTCFLMLYVLSFLDWEDVLWQEDR